MAKLEILASGPGTGKTTFCIDIFRKEILRSPGGLDSRSFFVLPNKEHAGRIQNLILKKDIPGLFNVHILTIDDLTLRFLGSKAVSRPTDMLRQSLLRSVLEDSSNPLSYFEAVKDLTGFHEMLSETIQEFKSSLMSMEEFENRAQKLLSNPVFKAKYRDFSIVVKRYEDKLREIGLGESEENIFLLRQNENEAGDFADLVIFDGFYHFTGAQKALIEYVTQGVSKVLVTLTLPENKGSRPYVFGHAESTFQFLKGLGFKPCPDFSCKKQYRTKDEALIHLEQNLFMAAPQKFPNPQESIYILESQDPRHEMEHLASEIRRLHRQEEVHYSDFCVIFRSLSGLEKVLFSVFEDYEIPFHIHERRKLLESGLARTLYRIFRLFAEDWNKEDIQYLIRSNYIEWIPEAACAADFEKKSYTEGISGGKEKLINLSQESPGTAIFFKSLLDIESQWKGAKTAAHLTMRIGRLAESFLRNSHDFYEVDAIAMHSIREILKFIESQPAQSFNPEAIFANLMKYFEAGLFSVKSSGKNRVQIYDVVMALPKEYKIVFIAGLTEGVFPKEVSEHALFKDDERKVLNENGVLLEERKKRLSGERYFFYMSISRAKSRLYLSYSLRDSQGRPSMRSFFIQQVMACFSSLELLENPSRWQSVRQTERLLAHSLFSCYPNLEPEDENKVLGAAFILKNQPRFKGILEAGLNCKMGEIHDVKILKEFLKINGPFSATRLESFATCAFKHFSRYILNLEEPTSSQLNRWMGSLLHDVLYEFYQTVKREEFGDPSFWMDQTKAYARLENILKEQFAKSPFSKEPLYSQKVVFRRMKQTLSLFAQREQQFSKIRRFSPAQFEVAFGDKKVGGRISRHPFLEIGREKIRIGGAIDRLDVMPDGKTVLVIDYKLGKRYLRKDLEKGIELQLPIYMLAAKKVLGFSPAGAELRYLQKGEEEGIYHESIRQDLGFTKAKGMESDEVFNQILSDAESGIISVVSRLRRGDISVRSKSCEYCAYNDVCRFEKWRLIYEEMNDGIR